MEGSKPDKIYSLAEVRQHKDAKSLWIAISDEVLDVTKFLEEVQWHLVEQVGVAGVDDETHVAIATETHWGLKLLPRYWVDITNTW